jgi:hypothetical protein
VDGTPLPLPWLQALDYRTILPRILFVLKTDIAGIDPRYYMARSGVIHYL